MSPFAPAKGAPSGSLAVAPARIPSQSLKAARLLDGFAECFERPRGAASTLKAFNKLAQGKRSDDSREGAALDMQTIAQAVEEWTMH